MSPQDAISIATNFVSLASQSLPIQKAFIFGSYAKNVADESSDIDVCVVSPALGKDIIDETVFLGQIAGQIDLRIEPHPMSPEDFAEKYNPLAHEIRTHGIPLTVK
ncbi:nucleotidyltransferase domain-containing protein [Candidatus Amesbacteria bacterium]|nr:nucleotidyltransferase domain-containing protein [Candidatus Amesbacteria bacterium]